MGKPSPSLRQLLTRIANPIPELTLQHPDAVWDMALSQDRSWLATACKDEYVRLWKIESGECVAKFGPHALGATAVAFSPDDKVLATGDRDGFVRLFRVEDSKELAVSGPRDGGIESLVWSPDGKWLVAGVRYQHVQVFDSLGKEWFQIPPGSTQPRYVSLCFRKQSDQLVVANRNGLLEVWELASRQRLTQYGTAGELHYDVFDFVGSEQQYLVAGRSQQTCFDVYQTDSGQKVGSMNTVVSLPNSIAESPDHARLAISFDGGRLLVRSLPGQADADWDDRVLHRLHEPGSSVHSVLWLDAERLLTSGDDGCVHLWALDRLVPLRTTILPGNQTCIIDGEIVAAIGLTNSRFGQLRVVRVGDLDKPSKDLLETISLDTGGRLQQHFRYKRAINSFAARIAVDYSDGIGIFDLNQGRQLQEIGWQNLWFDEAEGPKSRVKQIIWSATGSSLAVVVAEPASNSRSYSAHIFRSSDGWLTYQFVGQSSVPYMTDGCLIDDGRTLVADVLVEEGGGELKREIQRIENATGVTQTLAAIRDVREFAISRDERLLAVAADPGVRLIDMESAKELYYLNSSLPHGLQFSDDDRILLAQLADNSLHVWHLPTRTHLGKIAVFRNPRGSQFEAESEFGGRLFFSWADSDGQLEVSSLGAQ